MQLAPDEVHCWTVGLDITPERCAALSAILSGDELLRRARLRSPQLQQRFVAAHGALRELLGGYLDVHPGELRFTHNEFGKPALSGDFGGRLTFNLSHSADLALIGIAAGAEIGVDVEQEREEPEFTDITRWLFTSPELDEFNRLPSALRTRSFLTLWTRREAYVKAVGTGLGVMYENAQPAGWSVYSLRPAPGYLGALVVERSGWRVTQRWARALERSTACLLRLRHGPDRLEEPRGLTCQSPGAVRVAKGE